MKNFILILLLFVGCSNATFNDSIKPRVLQSLARKLRSLEALETVPAAETSPTTSPTENTAALNELASTVDIETVEAAVEPFVVTTADFYVIDWTANWCSWCVKWQRNEQPILEAAGIEVQPKKFDQNRNEAATYNITRLPAVQIWQRSTGKMVGSTYIGYRSADSILSIVNGLVPRDVSSQENRSPYLDMIVKMYGNRSINLSWSVQPETQVWDHLVEHGFARNDVTTLTQSQALKLHDAVHTGRINPR